MRYYGMLLLALTGCSLSVAADAETDCYRLETVIGDLGFRCGGHSLSSEVFKCDGLWLSNITSSDVDACRDWARTVDCEGMFPMPKECHFSGIWL